VQEIIRAPLEVKLAPLRRNVRFVRFRMTRRLKFCDSPLFEEISNAHTGLPSAVLLDPQLFSPKDRPASPKIK
jgi:hypothetical protein